MKKMKKTQVLEDVPELMQHIQSRLPVKAAARTSVLSKSWLQAWSTIPILRFRVPKEQERKHLMLVYVDRTLNRYLQDNIPIERFDLEIRIENQEESASLAEKWIRSVATKTCLKELSLAISFARSASFKLPYEILSGDNLTKIRVSAWGARIHSPPIINCVSLRELHLSGVRISQQLLDDILSSCRLLEKIELKSCSQDLKTIKVKSLPYLNELRIVTAQVRRCPRVEINNVPNLYLFSCYLQCLQTRRVRFNAHSISLGSSVTELSLGGPGLVTDDACLDMIKTGVPFLESLTLNMAWWKSGSFQLTCASVKRISLLFCTGRLIDIQINAVKLLFFCLRGDTMPSLSFPISTTLEEITFRLRLDIPFGTSFFLKMREALELSSKCCIHITTCWNHEAPLDMDLLDDLKTSLQFPPAKNVQTLSFETSEDECLSPFFDAFFEICHPKHVSAKLKLREVLENKTTRTGNWPHYVKHVQIRTRRHEKWETLSNSHTSFLDGPAPSYANFKLEWSLKG